LHLPKESRPHMGDVPPDLQERGERQLASGPVIGMTEAVSACLVRFDDRYCAHPVHRFMLPV
jgi:hypothetical protein